MIINFCVSNAVTIVFVLELVLVINSESTVNVQVAQVWHFVVSIGLYLCLFLLVQVLVLVLSGPMIRQSFLILVLRRRTLDLHFRPFFLNSIG